MKSRMNDMHHLEDTMHLLLSQVQQDGWLASMRGASGRGDG